MSIKSAGLVAILLVIACLIGPAPLGAAPPQPAAQASAEDEADARIQLSERFWDLGISLAGSTRASKAAIRESATLIEAATRMNPFEPRFWRLLAMIREQGGDSEGAIEAWTKYRSLAPDDRVAQVEVIDLYLRRFQTNEEKIKYLTSLLGKASLHNHVKAWVAVKLVPLLDQRSREQAIAMLAQARGFYPLPEVTLLEWQMLPADATPIQRFNALLNILRANPTQAEAIGKVADMLAGAGLSEQALSWYSILLDVHVSQGTEPDQSSVTNYLAERYRAGESTVAAEQLDSILQRYPDSPEDWLLRLTIARGDESASMLKQAQQVFLRRLNIVCDRILKQPVPGAPPVVPTTAPALIEPALPSQAVAQAQAAATTAPATQPLEQPAPPVAETVARVEQLANPQLREALVASLADLAWFEVYFDHQPGAAAPALKGLTQLVPADNVALRRLQGWFDLASGHEAEARAVFTAQQSIDPLSALGLFKLEDQKGRSNEAAAIGSKILADPRSGVLGAILWQATKGRGFKPTTQPAIVTALQTALDKFPKDWLQVGHTPYRFYSLRADPIKVGHRLGEPLLAVVAIQNECKLDITIGDYGLIKPTLIFDAQIRGSNPRTFRGIAIDRIMGRLVLTPGESVTQVVRLDQGELSDSLRLRPAVTQSVNADVVTNPLAFGNHFGASAAGYAKNFSKMLVRTPVSLAQDRDRRKLFAEMAAGSPGEKILDIELLAAYVTQYAQPGATVEEKTFATQYTNAIEQLRSDRAPGVKLWASYSLAILLSGAKEQQVIGEMLQSSSWESRLLGLVAARFLPAESLRQLAVKNAAGDPDPLVKTYASALVELLQSPTTQPAAIQPATTEPVR